MGRNLDRFHQVWSRLAGAILLGGETLASVTFVFLWFERRRSAEALLLTMIVLGLLALLDRRLGLRRAHYRDQARSDRKEDG